MLVEALTITASQLRTQMSGTIVLGIGNRLGADDAVGPCLVDRLNQWQHDAETSNAADITAIDAGTAPESYTSVIRRHQPDLLILVDAADMGLPPGALRTIPSDKISVLSFSTHHMPICIFISYVEEFCGKVLLIGVQPERAEMGGQISKAVHMSVKQLAKSILEGRVGKIPPLE